MPRLRASSGVTPPKAIGVVTFSSAVMYWIRLYDWKM